METDGLVKKIEGDFISGRSILPFAGKDYPIDGKICHVPRIPDRVTISNVYLVGRGFKSVSERDYNYSIAQKSVSDLMEYIHASELLKEPEIEVEFVQGINGKLPLTTGKLDSLTFDPRIRVRPVSLHGAYHFDLQATYDLLYLNDRSKGISFDVRDVELGLKEGTYFAPLDEGLRIIGRLYGIENGSPLIVHRYPVWINVNSTGVEKEARLPLEVLSSLLEPHTSARITERVNEFMQNLEEDYREAEQLGITEKQKELKKAKLEGPEQIMNMSIREEKAVAAGIVKAWLIARSNQNGLRPNDIISWQPYDESEIYSQALANDVKIELNRCPPKKMVQFYCSGYWREWSESEDNEDIDVSELDFEE